MLDSDAVRHEECVRWTTPVRNSASCFLTSFQLTTVLLTEPKPFLVHSLATVSRNSAVYSPTLLSYSLAQLTHSPTHTPKLDTK